MRRRPRGLSPEEIELWRQVARSARSLRPDGKEPEAEAGATTAEAAPAVDRRTALPRPPPVTDAGFRIGSKTPSPAWQARGGGGGGQGDHRQPGPSQRAALAAQPLRMDHSTYVKMTRGKIAPEARLDLHGMTLNEAHAELIRFILGAHAGGMRLVLVITGKGKGAPDHGPIPHRVGALRFQVPHWLQLPPLAAAVLQISGASLRHGGDGAYYVYLRRHTVARG